MTSDNTCIDRVSSLKDSNELDQEIKDLLSKDPLVNYWSENVLETIRSLSNKYESVKMGKLHGDDSLWWDVISHPVQTLPENDVPNIASVGLIMDPIKADRVNIKEFCAKTKTFYINNFETIYTSFRCSVIDNVFRLDDLVNLGNSSKKNVSFNVDDLDVLVLNVVDNFNPVFFVKGLLRNYRNANNEGEKEFNGIGDFVVSNINTVKESLYLHVDVSLGIELKTQFHPIVFNDLFSRAGRKIQSLPDGDNGNGFGNITAFIRSMVRNSSLSNKMYKSTHYLSDFEYIQNVLTAFSEKSLDEAVGELIKWVLRNSNELESISLGVKL